LAILLGTIFADGHHIGGDYFDMPVKEEEEDLEAKALGLSW
jgi:thiamine monophosphate synthase